MLVASLRHTRQAGTCQPPGASQLMYPTTVQCISLVQPYTSNLYILGAVPDNP